MWQGVAGCGVDPIPGFCIIPPIYPINPLAPSNCLIFVFHWSRLSLLNFCSSESIVSEGIPAIMRFVFILELYEYTYRLSALGVNGACNLS